MAGKRSKGDGDRYKAFLAAFRKIGNQTQAAAIAGISISAVKQRVHDDPLFAARLSKAKGQLIGRIVEAQVEAAVRPDAHGRYDTKAGQFLLTNLDPVAYKHRREDVQFDGGAYESGIAAARDSLTEEERKELQELGKRRILQRGSAE